MSEHATTPHRWITQLLAIRGSGRRGPLWQCPAHNDPGPSLAVTETNDHARVHCYAGCDTEHVLQALGVPMRYLYRAPSICPATFAARYSSATFPPVVLGDNTPGQAMRLDSEHHYGSPARAWLMRYRHPQTGAKRCMWESRNGHGERVPGLLGVELGTLPLYQERDAVAAVAMDEIVVVVESESSVDALRRAGVVAVTWAGGAASPNLEALTRVLGGHRRVVILGDADEAGRGCAARIAGVLPLAAVVAPEVEGEDGRDVLARVGAEGFRRLVVRAAR